jgi:hypothetical protein
VYPSVELLLVQWGTARFSPHRVATETPPDLQDVLPLIRFTRFGGTDDVLTLDQAHVDVDVYAATWAEADDLARLVRVALRTELVGQSVTTGSGTAVIARVGTIAAPARRPTADPNLHRSGASYQIVTHSH